MFTEIHELIKAKKYDNAIALLKPIVTGNDEKASAYAGYLLGYINTCHDYSSKKDYLAQRYLRENVYSNYPHPYAYVLYSRLVDDQNVALNHLNKGLERFPQDIRILGELMLVSPEKDTIVNIVRDRGINNPWMLGRVISYLISTNQWNQIRLFITRIEQEQDISVEDMCYLGLVETYANLFGDTPDYEKAQSALLKIIDDDIENTLAYSHYLGLIYAFIKTGNIQHAEYYFDRIPVNNSITDFDDGPRLWDINVNFEYAYRIIFDSILETFAQDSLRKCKASALYSLYLYYPSEMCDIYRFKKSDATALNRYLKIGFNKDVASALFSMRCYFRQWKEAYEVLWSFLQEFEDPEDSLVLFSEILDYVGQECIEQVVNQTMKHLENDSFDIDCFVKCIFNELICKLHELKWHSKIRMLAQRLSDNSILQSKCVFQCAYAFGDVEDKRATALYEELIKREPDNDAAMNNLGVQYKIYGELYKALECYEKAHQLNPKKELYKNNLDIIRDCIRKETETTISLISDSISMDSLEGIGYSTDLCRRILLINDIEMREIIQRDLRECAVAVVAGQDKMATIMCGSIIEALLMQKIAEKGIIKYDITAISNGKKAPNYPVSEMSLNELLFVADKETLLDKNSYHLGHYIRDYRNVVHPAKEIRMREEITHENVVTMWSILRKLISDLFPME